MDFNIRISGEEARIILQAMGSQGINYPGQLLPMVVSVYNRLVELHLNMPPVAEPQKKGE